MKDQIFFLNPERTKRVKNHVDMIYEYRQATFFLAKQYIIQAGGLLDAGHNDTLHYTVLRFSSTHMVILAHKVLLIS